MQKPGGAGGGARVTPLVRTLRFRFLRLGKPSVPQEKQHPHQGGGQRAAGAARGPWGRPPPPPPSGPARYPAAPPPATQPALTAPRPEVTHMGNAGPPPGKPRPSSRRPARSLRRPPEVRLQASGPAGGFRSHWRLPGPGQRALVLLGRDGLGAVSAGRTCTAPPPTCRPRLLGSRPSVEGPGASPEGGPRAFLPGTLQLFGRGTSGMGSRAPWPWAPGPSQKHRELREKSRAGGQLKR